MTLTPIPLDDLPPTTELLPARADTDSWVQVVRDVSTLAAQIAETEFVPRGLRGSVPATAAAILYGREVGLPPMTALSQIHVVEGRPGLSAEAMRALVLAAGHEIVFDETTTATCRIRGRRLRSQTWTDVEWTIDLARKAGLLRRGSGWESYPRDMLVARATTSLCRMIFPDVIHGFRSTEELDDMAATPATSTSPRTRATVARRPKTPPAAESDEGESNPTAADTSTPPTRPARTPSLPGESEDPDPSDPVPPRHAGQPDETPPPPGPDYPTPPITPPPAAEEDRGPDLVNRVTLKIVFGQLRRLGLGDDDQGRPDRLALLARLAGRDDLDSANDLTQDEGTQIATILSTFRDAAALFEFVGLVIEDPPGEGES